jgi:2-keto-4-pentenoate hydratase
MTDLAHRLWGARRTGGTCTGLDSLMRGDRVQADFGDLGSVEISFE